MKTTQLRNSLVLFFIYNVGFFLFISNLSLFAKAQFHVDADQVSFYMAWIGMLRVVIQTLFIARILRVLGEYRALRIGIIAMIVSMVGIAFSADYLFVFVPLLFLAFGTGVSRPILMSKLTYSVTKKETATILGVNNSLNSVAHILTPIVGGLIIQNFPSQVIPILAALFFLTLLFFLRNKVKF